MYLRESVCFAPRPPAPPPGGCPPPGPPAPDPRDPRLPCRASRGRGPFTKPDCRSLPCVRFSRRNNIKCPTTQMKFRQITFNSRSAGSFEWGIFRPRLYMVAHLSPPISFEICAHSVLFIFRKISKSVQLKFVRLFEPFCLTRIPGGGRRHRHRACASPAACPPPAILECYTVIPGESYQKRG